MKEEPQNGPVFQFLAIKKIFYLDFVTTFLANISESSAQIDRGIKSLSRIIQFWKIKIFLSQFGH